jgi:subtilisin family serine protease
VFNLKKTAKIFPNKPQKLSAVFFLLFFCLDLIVPTIPIASAQALPQASYVERSYVIKLKQDTRASLNTVATKVEQQFGFTSKAQFSRIFRFSSPANIDYLRQQLKGQFEYLELDQPVIAKADATLIDTGGSSTNDPGFTLNTSDVDRQWGLPKARFPSAWKKTTGSLSTIVAIVDTGIDQTHEDLSDVNYVRGYNFRTDENISPGRNSDDNGHGTLVAGIIAATANNRTGIVGTNWDVTLMPLKALSTAGTGNVSDISQALVWATDHGAHIINLSLGGLGFGHDTTLANAITYAYENNVLLVAAAGNDVAVTGGNLDDSPVFPICDDNGQNMVLGVTASDTNDVKPSFANFGKSCIDVSAPGKRILSTINHDPSTGAAAPDSYAYASGTSMAVPYVVGQAALLRAVFRNATNSQLRDRIITSSDNIDNNNLSQCANASCRGFLGAGRINVLSSMQENIISVNVKEGDVVQLKENNALYLISGGKRHLISPFVKSQRYATSRVKEVSLSDIEKFPEGNYAEPLDGTLIKMNTETTVYYMSQGLRLPVTYQVFLLRGFKFTDVNVLSYSEVNSWLEGSFLAPPDGSLIRTSKDPTVYWIVDGVLHPINSNFYKQRGLNVFPVIFMSDEDVKGFSKGEPYIL